MKDYRKLFKFALPYRKELIFSGVLMGLLTLLDVFRLSAIVPVVDRIFTNKPIVFTQAKLPSFIQNIINQLNTWDPVKVLYVILIVMPVAAIIRAVIDYWQGYLMSGVGQRVIRDTRSMIYEKLQNLSLDYFTHKRSGELISRITNDVGLIDNAVSYALTDLVYESSQVIFYTVMIIMIHWKMALGAVVVLPMVAIPMVAVGKVLRKLSKKGQEKMADIISLLVETFNGVRIVKAFCAEDREIKRFKGQNYDYYKIKMKSIKRMLLLGNATDLLGMLMGLFVIYCGFMQVMNNTLSFGVFFLFTACFLSLIKPFKKLSQVNSIIQQAMAASVRIYEVLDLEPTVKQKFLAADLLPFKENIEFENVWFKYAEADILKNINLKVRKGDVLAIVGPSGAGKSTLADLVPRFYDPAQGKIFVDGQDIREVNIKSLRQQIGIVTQEIILFNDTIKANIVYGNTDAPMEAIENAAREAHAHDFIKNLPAGYETIIGDRGIKLSGGERQRIAIARALLKNPPILILDEATSQLDTESERLVQAALDRLIQGRTVFVIAHRLSTVRNAHRIIVLDKGKIVEEGSHTELFARDGLYKRLYQMQEIE